MVLAHRDNEISLLDQLPIQDPLSMQGGIGTFPNQSIIDNTMDRLGFGDDAGRSDPIGRVRTDLGPYCIFGHQASEDVSSTDKENGLSHSQDVEKALQLRSRFAQRLNVRNRVRLASSLAVALLKGFLTILGSAVVLFVSELSTAE